MDDRSGKLDVLVLLSETYDKKFSEPALELMVKALEPLRLEDIQKILPSLMRERQWMPTVADIADAVQDLEDEGLSVVSRVRSKYMNSYPLEDAVTQKRLNTVLNQMGMEPDSVGAREI
jgi:hypothetical protein